MQQLGVIAFFIPARYAQALTVGWQYFVKKIGTEESDQLARLGEDVLIAVLACVDAQLATVFLAPVLIEIENGSDDSHVIVPKLIKMFAIV